MNAPLTSVFAERVAGAHPDAMRYAGALTAAGVAVEAVATLGARLGKALRDGA